MIPVLPDDVRQWLLSIFGSCNQHVAKQLSALPTIHEPALDMALISHLGMFSGPTRFPSDWLVQIAAFFEGGRRHWRNWEVADIGFLITFRRPGAVPIQKLALLQSKRLYPEDAGINVPEAVHGNTGVESVVYEFGGVNMFEQPRLFETSEQSSYKALRMGDNQYQVIPSYEEDTGVPIYYLFYNPLDLPSSVLLPRMGGPIADARCIVGCRVAPSSAVRDAMRDLRENQSPTYALLAAELGARLTQPRCRLDGLLSVSLSMLFSGVKLVTGVGAKMMFRSIALLHSEARRSHQQSQSPSMYRVKDHLASRSQSANHL